MGKSKIEWTDYTFNPWIGCCKVSPGCQYCYAEREFTRKSKWANCWGPPETSERKRTSEANWKKPLMWNKQAEKANIRYKVLCASLGDWAEDNPQVEEWRIDLFRMMLFDTPNLDWLLLTKRIENVIPFMDNTCWPETGCPIFGSDDSLPNNVWIGTSVENQETADKRIPELLRIPAKVHFLSLEPLLEPVDLIHSIYRPGIWDRIHPDHNYLLAASLSGSGINWVIVGGESGPKAHPMNPDWVRAIRDQVVPAEIPFFVKQMGDAWAKGNNASPKGGEITEWPGDLQIREFPI